MPWLCQPRKYCTLHRFATTNHFQCCVVELREDSPLSPAATCISCDVPNIKLVAGPIRQEKQYRPTGTVIDKLQRQSYSSWWRVEEGLEGRRQELQRQSKAFLCHKSETISLREIYLVQSKAARKCCPDLETKPSTIWSYITLLDYIRTVG